MQKLKTNKFNWKSERGNHAQISNSCHFPIEKKIEFGGGGGQIKNCFQGTTYPPDLFRIGLLFGKKTYIFWRWSSFSGGGLLHEIRRLPEYNLMRNTLNFTCVLPPIICKINLVLWFNWNGLYFESRSNCKFDNFAIFQNDFNLLTRINIKFRWYPPPNPRPSIRYGWY